MELICVSCHTKLTGMSAGSGTFKLECPKCAPELLQVREMLEKLRLVMDRFEPHIKAEDEL